MLPTGCAGPAGAEDAPPAEADGNPGYLAAHATLARGDRANAFTAFLAAAKDPSVRLDSLEQALALRDAGKNSDLVFEIDAASTTERDPARVTALRTLRIEATVDPAMRERELTKLDEETGRRSPWPISASARMQEERGSFAGAEQAYARALERDPRDVRALRGLARCRIAQKDVNGAITALSRAATQAPADPVIRYNLGRLLLDRPTGANDARLNLRAASRLEPTDVPTLVAYAVACMRTDDPKEAEKLLLRARDLAPTDPDVHFNLGVVYADKLHDKPAAIAAFKQYLAVGGDETDRVKLWLEQLERPAK